MPLVRGDPDSVAFLAKMGIVEVARAGRQHDVAGQRVRRSSTWRIASIPTCWRAGRRCIDPARVKGFIRSSYTTTAVATSSRRPNSPAPTGSSFTFADLATRFPFRVYDPQRPLDQGNTTFPILAFFHARPGHSAYWRIEYDVLYDGEWRDFFRTFEDNAADLLTTTLYRPDIRPDWGWWPTLAKPWHEWRPLRRVRAFMPIARLSPRALSTIDRAYAKGWAGHDETLVPSVLQSYGLTIADLGGDGEFTPEGAEGRFYSNTPTARGLAPGTFVCPPFSPRPASVLGQLYHPVKDRAAWLLQRHADRQAVPS